jgi:hypothetical protein
VLAIYYGEYLREHGGRPPQDEAEFREFLATRKERLAASGLDADRVLASPRNGLPLVVVCGGSELPVVDGIELIAYEKSAVDEKRMVVTPRGGTELIDEGKFSAAVRR